MEARYALGQEGQRHWLAWDGQGGLEDMVPLKPDPRETVGLERVDLRKQKADAIPKLLTWSATQAGKDPEDHSSSTSAKHPKPKLPELHPGQKREDPDRPRGGEL